MHIHKKASLLRTLISRKKSPVRTGKSGEWLAEGDKKFDPERIAR